MPKGRTSSSSKKPGSPRKSPVRSAKRSIGRPAGKSARIGKELLVAKTAELLRTLPPEKLSLSAAARHARVHLTLFKYYFKDRTHLLVDVAFALSVEIGERIANIETGDLSAPDRLAIRVDAMIEFFLLNPFYHRLMVEIMSDETNPLATEMINIWMSKTLDIYRSIIDAGVAEGTLRRVDPQFTFLAIMGICEKFGHTSKLFTRNKFVPHKTPESAAARYKAFVLEMVLEGVGAAPASGIQRALLHPERAN
jgi:AcrR family transcriptional regulator